MKVKEVFALAKESVESFGKHKDQQHAAALSFYTIFSLAPLLVISIAVAGLVFGQTAAQNQIVSQISSTVGSDAANLIQTMIQNVNKPGSSILATLFGFVTLFATAAGAFAQMKGSINAIWDANPPPGPGGIKGILVGIRQQLLSFVMVLATGLLLLISLVISTALGAASTAAGNSLPIPAAFWELLNFAASFVILLIMFAAIYKVLPDVPVAWRNVWFGAVVTAGLFMIGKWLIGFYLGHTANTSTYGAAGSLVLVLLWIYYSAHIFLLGVEFTYIHAKQHGQLDTHVKAQIGNSNALSGKDAGQSITKTAHIEGAN